MSGKASSRQEAKSSRKVSRSASTGRYVAKSTAARHPSATVTERISAGPAREGKLTNIIVDGTDAVVLPGTTTLPRTAVRTAFLIDALGSGAEVARLLGVNRSQPSQWRSGKESPSPRTAQQLLDLDYVMAKALQIWPAETALEWFHGSNDYLDGARPIDVLKRRGTTEIIKVLDLEMA